MQTQVRLSGREVRVSLSPAEEAALRSRAAPLHAEMELYFSCLIRKRVRFDVPARGEAAFVADGLTVSFRPVMSRGGCSVADHDPEELLVDLPTGEPQRFVPHWLKLDYRRGVWAGEFGYSIG